MSNAYDYREDPELAGRYVTMGKGAATDRYDDEPTARIVVRPSSVVRLPEQEDTRMSDALVRMGTTVEQPDRVIAPESYKPAPAWATGLVEGARDYVKRPGQTMTPNPHDPASEEWQAYEDFRNRNAVNFGGETALNIMGTGGVVGVPLKAGEMALGAGVVRDPRLWSPISNTKLRKPLDEMEHSYTDTRVPVPKFVDPASLVGGYGVFPPWDLSAANRTVTHIDKVPLERPVTLHGGMGFPEANPGMAAASEQAISRRLENQAERIARESGGKPVYIMPMTMGGTGVDASHHVADPIAQLVQKAPVTAEDMKAFNEMMHGAVANLQKGKKKTEEIKPWVDTTDPRFQDYIANMKGGMTIKALMADRMSLAQWQKKGFPDVAAIRHAVSDPGPIDVPTNTVGAAISRYEPGKGLLETSHPSYPKGVAGYRMGQLATLLPFETTAPAIAKGLAAKNAENFAMGKTVAIQPAYHMGRPTAGVPTEQYFDDQWLEGVMKRLGER